MTGRAAAVVFSFALFACASCANTSADRRILEAEESQVKLRVMQTRAFDSTDENRMIRSVISALQDLGFVIESAEVGLGTVSATKLDRYDLKVTVTVKPRGERQLVVRANAQFDKKPVEDPAPYQRFFEALSKSIFLEAQEVH
jgi:hypothetical protein